MTNESQYSLVDLLPLCVYNDRRRRHRIRFSRFIHVQIGTRTPEMCEL